MPSGTVSSAGFLGARVRVRGFGAASASMAGAATGAGLALGLGGRGAAVFSAAGCSDMVACTGTTGCGAAGSKTGDDVTSITGNGSLGWLGRG